MRGSSSQAMKQHRVRKNPCLCSKICYFGIAVIFYLVVSASNDASSLENLGLRASNKKDDHCKEFSSLSIDELSQLKRLNLNGCDLDNLPQTIQFAKNLSFLDIGNNPRLTTLPNELSSCTKLEILFASNCKGIKSLPKVLGLMSSITRLGWRSGSLRSIDPDGLPPNLVHLILTDNDIQRIDNEAIFEKLQNVRKLMLSHNQISNFGDDKGSIKKLRRLELLRIAGNELTSIPDDLWSLPKLTWLTVSGNPFMTKLKVESKVPWIHENELQSTGKYLGEGASGKVTSYRWNDQAVAVKLIHGVTSDGKAEDELSVYGAVGPDGLHHRVVGCVALLNGNKKGAVMQQLPENLKDLALPPTIVEVTEDRWSNWKNNTTFSAEFVQNVLTDVATALQYLHNDVGVAHGDVYAHNMKVQQSTGRVYLLDFGASYFTGEYREKAEKLEIRAFGVLIGELKARLNIKDDTIYRSLTSLQQQCEDEDVKSRPTFTSIIKALRTIKN